jgi:hypothetical protein
MRVPFRSVILDACAKCNKYQDAFIQLGETDFDCNEVFETLETFICHLYGTGLTRTIPKRKVNDVRFSLFNRQYKLHDVNEPF